MSNSITYLIFEDKFFCHMYTLCNVHWLATSSKSKLQIKHYSIFSQQEMAAHGRGCPEGEEAPHGAEIAVCSHPQVIKLNVHTANCHAPGQGLPQPALQLEPPEKPGQANLPGHPGQYRDGAESHFNY